MHELNGGRCQNVASNRFNHSKLVIAVPDQVANVAVEGPLVDEKLSLVQCLILGVLSHRNSVFVGFRVRQLDVIHILMLMKQLIAQVHSQSAPQGVPSSV